MSSKNDFYTVEELRMIKAEYITKTLYTLSKQLFFTFGSLILVNYVDVIREHFIQLMSELYGIGMIGSFIVLFWAMDSNPQTIFQLGLFTVFQTLVLCSISLSFDFTILIGGIGLLFIITIVLSICAYFSKRISSSTERIMFGGLTTLLMGGLINISFENDISQMIELYSGMLLFMAYIVLDVQRTIDRNVSLNPRKDIHIMACLNIYLDIINLFIKLLQIYYSMYKKKNKHR